MTFILKGRGSNIGYALISPETSEGRNGDPGENLGSLTSWHVLHGRTVLPLAHFEIAKVEVGKRGRGALLEIKPVGRDRVRGVSFVKGSGGSVNEQQLPAGKKGTIRQSGITFKFETE